MEIERIAVTVTSRIAKHAVVAVFFEPAQLNVVGDVGPQQISPHAVPGGAFGP